MLTDDPGLGLAFSLSLGFGQLQSLLNRCLLMP